MPPTTISASSSIGVADKVHRQTGKTIITVAPTTTAPPGDDLCATLCLSESIRVRHPSLEENSIDMVLNHNVVYL